MKLEAANRLTNLAFEIVASNSDEAGIAYTTLKKILGEGDSTREYGNGLIQVVGWANNRFKASLQLDSGRGLQFHFTPIAKGSLNPTTSISASGKDAEALFHAIRNKTANIGKDSLQLVNVKCQKILQKLANLP